MPSKRLYTESEISAILKRSGELQSQRGESAQGLSIDELQQIAREVGIDPDILMEAAAELERKGGVKKGRRWAGMPVELVVERVIEGEIGEAQWPEAAAEISEAFGLVGSSSQVGRMLQWTHTGRRFNQLQVTLTPRDGQTKIRVQGTYRQRAFALLPLILFGLAQGFFIPLSQGLPAIAAAGISLAIAGTIYLMVMLGFSTFIGQRERDSIRLVDRLERMMTPRRNDAGRTPVVDPVAPEPLVIPTPTSSPEAQSPSNQRTRA